MQSDATVVGSLRQFPYSSDRLRGDGTEATVCTNLHCRCCVCLRCFAVVHVEKRLQGNPHAYLRCVTRKRHVGSWFTPLNPSRHVQVASLASSHPASIAAISNTLTELTEKMTQEIS